MIAFHLFSFNLSDVIHPHQMESGNKLEARVPTSVLDAPRPNCPP